jgi:hypothetical protein
MRKRCYGDYPMTLKDKKLITRIDCWFSKPLVSQNKGSLLYCAFSPLGRPGTLVAAGVSPTATMTGQLAGRLALDHFVQEVSKKGDAPFSDACESGTHLELLEEVLKAVNEELFQFGSKMTMGGEVVTSLSAIIIASEGAAVARIGDAGAFLLRGGEVFSFFEQESSADEQLLGQSPTVKAHLAAVGSEEYDVVALSCPPIAVDRFRDKVAALNWSGDPCGDLLSAISFSGVQSDQFLMLTKMGPRAIYLSEVREQ